MGKAFFGGSRRMGRLSQAVRERTDNVIANGYLTLLGDANGADKAMQRYLAEKNYRNVLGNLVES
jgi:adenine-specific DNA-methyltransferase